MDGSENQVQSTLS